MDSSVQILYSRCSRCSAAHETQRRLFDKNWYIPILICQLCNLDTTVKAALTSARLGPGTTLLLSPAWSGHLLPLLRRRSYSLTVTSPILVNESNYTFTSRDSSLHLMPNSSHPLALLISSSHLTKIASSFIYPSPRTGAHHGVGNDICRHVMRLLLRTVKTLTDASVRTAKEI